LFYLKLTTDFHWSIIYKINAKARLNCFYQTCTSFPAVLIQPLLQIKFLSQLCCVPKYFFAVLPTTTILNEIIAFQREIEANFGSVHAQKTPPHITIIPPFDCGEEKLWDFTEKTSLFLADKSIIDLKIYLDNFQCFDGRTLFIDVAKNEPFEKLCKELKLLFNQQKITKQRVEKHFFIPHITIANKDIKKRDFRIASEDFKKRNYQRSFDLKTLAVLELVEEKWVVKTTITF